MLTLQKMSEIKQTNEIFLRFSKNTQSTVTKSAEKFEALDHVRNCNKGRKLISQDTKLNVLLDLKEYLNTATRALATSRQVSKTYVLE